MFSDANKTNFIGTLAVAAGLTLGLDGCSINPPSDFGSVSIARVGKSVSINGYLQLASEAEVYVDNARGGMSTTWRKLSIHETPDLSSPSVSAYVQDLQHSSLGSVFSRVSIGDRVKLTANLQRRSDGTLCFGDLKLVKCNSEG